MSFIKYEYININEYSRPGIRNNGVDGIVMHYTANKGGLQETIKTILIISKETMLLLSCL